MLCKKAVLRAQFTEYKIGHVIDKSVESLFGYISVLPGAFSVFRWEAIEDEPLDAFLVGLNTYTCKEKNLYLAEDRIMCFSIVSQAKHKYHLKFVPGAVALTDGPETIAGLFKQRRRWSNGAFFSQMHFMNALSSIVRNPMHTRCFKFGFLMLFMVNAIYFCLSNLAVGLFYAVFSVVTRANLPSDDASNSFEYANLLENTILFFLALVSSLSLSPLSNTIFCFFRSLLGPSLNRRLTERTSTL